MENVKKSRCYRVKELECCIGEGRRGNPCRNSCVGKRKMTTLLRDQLFCVSLFQEFSSRRIRVQAGGVK